MIQRRPSERRVSGERAAPFGTSVSIEWAKRLPCDDAASGGLRRRCEQATGRDGCAAGDQKIASSDHELLRQTVWIKGCDDGIGTQVILFVKCNSQDVCGILKDSLTSKKVTVQ